ncbi:MAG TPA: CDP-alcohol phosphatidyltransferase family protein [Syntrophorhabdus sp.]|nr:CDP-alcohol phosphatidyltransferase family protein [Syntrophorhabdus sp.]HPB37508.1 CDP-alcohol phosphatidyltransferase family protein [Syntrophorhabdus sp.]HPW37003.1 CDP-alcohol phosphatidyltransferase family protein [Syntrophorhabdus sp.]HQB35205.1 CDP-alcohol phosphatidyltransferase family protein [Syntrophorhabdus sp.]HQO62884.1 CDP-alcohol phosphatidyltransferase family protein [Syntrophorhabdus sp.]
MNIPNLLTIFRLFLTSFFILAIHYGEFRIALWLFVVQAITDLLDGFLARVLGEKTSLGALLDPLADKTMLVSSFIVLYMKGIVPLWVTFIVLIRDFVLTFGYLILCKLFGKIEVIPSTLGKITTFCQIGTVVYVLWSDTRSYQDLFFYPTVALTIITGLHYVYQGILIIKNKGRVTVT